MPRPTLSPNLLIHDSIKACELRNTTVNVNAKQAVTAIQTFLSFKNLTYNVLVTVMSVANVSVLSSCSVRSKRKENTSK